MNDYEFNMSMNILESFYMSVFVVLSRARAACYSYNSVGIS